ncbi:hypothetical protein AX16_005549 [Volvariella volvacea WC 439]|nr:hypothetical protein AX16_005549 [Volvariella volvacea WC 439]
MFTSAIKTYGHGILQRPALRSIPLSRFARPMSTAQRAPLLLSPAEAHQLAKSPDHDVSILDATWFMPNSPRQAREEYLAQHLPNAQFLDLDEVAGPHELGLKHMMPSPQVFADACGAMGIKPSSHVIIYDAHGVFSAPRALFMFKTFGHANASIINGGLPRWLAEGFPTESGESRKSLLATYPPPTLFTGAIRNYEQVVENSKRDMNDPAGELVLDARSHGRYTGKDPEPRPGLASGHIPNSFSLPFNTFLKQNQGLNNTTYTTLLSPKEIKEALINAVGLQRAQLIIDGTASAVTTCGSGMTAGVLWLGLQLLGAHKVALYDESWTGYAMRKESVIEKSA